MGMSLADPSGSGIPNKLRGNYGVFATLEQTLYRAPGDTQKGVSATAKGVTILCEGGVQSLQTET